MPEPLEEATEEQWIETLNRFDSEIWPLFEGRGYAKGEAHILWRLTGLQLEMQDVNEKLTDGY